MAQLGLIGVGKSTPYLIDYLVHYSQQKGHQFLIADQNELVLKALKENYPSIQTQVVDVTKEQERHEFVKQTDLVVSMLPAFLHILLAKDCIQFKKHLFTASYVSEELKALEEEVKANGLTFFNECGLDPGIDHLSAMKIIDDLNDKGATITSFESYCGGLVAPESVDNPFGYKFSWNPRNVILAGQTGGQFLSHGTKKFLPYHRLFKYAKPLLIEGEALEAYPNRDSLGYQVLYGLQDVKTMIRGTLRTQGYCSAWDVFVQLGLTNDVYVIYNLEDLTYRDFMLQFLPDANGSIEEQLKCHFGVSETILEMIASTGLLSEEKIPLSTGTPAQVLEHLLAQKWKLKPHDKDLVVLHHSFEYEIKGIHYKIESTLYTIGENNVHTAMAKTVGLPLAIAVELFLEGEINPTGVIIPLSKEIYTPILKRLEVYGIIFKEELSVLDSDN